MANFTGIPSVYGATEALLSESAAVRISLGVGQMEGSGGNVARLCFFPMFFFPALEAAIRSVANVLFSGLAIWPPLVPAAEASRRSVENARFSGGTLFPPFRAMA